MITECSREGNEIPAADCELRRGYRALSQSLCADCKNILDICNTLHRHYRVKPNGFRQVIACDGFADVRECHQ